jgi:hypothetical protein
MWVPTSRGRTTRHRFSVLGALETRLAVLNNSLLTIGVTSMSRGLIRGHDKIGARGEHAKSWGACKCLNAKLRAVGKETALWGSWFGG